jgi:hypothetical protein
MVVNGRGQYKLRTRGRARFFLFFLAVQANCLADSVQVSLLIVMTANSKALMTYSYRGAFKLFCRITLFLFVIVLLFLNRCFNQGLYTVFVIITFFWHRVAQGITNIPLQDRS